MPDDGNSFRSDTQAGSAVAIRSRHPAPTAAAPRICSRGGREEGKYRLNVAARDYWHFGLPLSLQAVGLGVPLALIFRPLRCGWEFPQLVRVDRSGGACSQVGLRPDSTIWVK